MTQEQKADLERRLMEVLAQGIRPAEGAGAIASADISAAILAVRKTGTASPNGRLIQHLGANYDYNSGTLTVNNLLSNIILVYC